MMTEKELLDKYIDEKYSDCKPWLTEEQRKAIADTFEFRVYCLHATWAELKKEMRKIFPFSLFVGDE